MTDKQWTEMSVKEHIDVAQKLINELDTTRPEKYNNHRFQLAQIHLLVAGLLTNTTYTAATANVPGGYFSQSWEQRK